MTIRGLTEALIKMRREAQSAENTAKELNTLADEYEQKLFDLMADAKVSSLRYEDLGVQVVASVKKFPRIRPECKDREDEIFEFLRQNGQGGVIRLQVNAQTMKAALRELAEGGIEMPEFIETYSQNTVALKKG